MKLTVQYHAGNPDLCRIPELTIRPMPECEGGGWYLPRHQAEFLTRIAGNLTDEMQDAGFDAIRGYEALKEAKVFPRPTLTAHIFKAMVAAATRSGTVTDAHASNTGGLS